MDKYTLDLTREQAQALKVMGLEPEKVKEEREWPQENDDYYYIIDGLGNIGEDRWSDALFERRLLSMGNAFKSLEDAEFEAERRKVWHELSKFAEGDDAKWDRLTRHWQIIFNYNYNDIDLDFVCSLRYSELYFASDEIAKEAIEAVGRDRIKKYYLGIKED